MHPKEAVARWRAPSLLQLAEQILAHAALVKEANVLSRWLELGVSFQCALPDRALACSALEGILGDAAEDIRGDAELSPRRLSIVVRVLDYGQLLVHYWSLPRLERHVRAMARVRAMCTHPGAAYHIEPRRVLQLDSVSPFAHVGSLLLPLGMVVQGSEFVHHVPIRSMLTDDVLGQCEVALHHVGATHRGDQETVAVRLSVRRMKLRPGWFEEVHVQLHLADYDVDRHSARTHVSQPVAALDGTAEPEFQRTLLVPDTCSVRCAPVHVFARPTAAFFMASEEAETRREQAAGNDLVRVGGVPDAPSRERVHESERRHEQHYAVHARTQLLQRSSSGMYAPSRTLPGTQRSSILAPARKGRIRTVLQHDAGSQLPWTRIVCMSVRDVCLLNARGEAVQREPLHTSLPMLSAPVATQSPLGTTTLWAESQWDPSVYACALLDEPTPLAHTVRFTLALIVDVAAPRAEAVELPVPMHVRVENTRRWGSDGRLRRDPIDTLFRLRFVPAALTNVQDLWRVDTRQVHVPGETVVEGWRPRGLSLLAELLAARRRERFFWDLCHVRARLATPGMEAEDHRSHASGKDKSELLFGCLATWLQAADPFAQVCLAAQCPFY